ncbi:MAG: hypothetical protein MMC33_006611 [Icmadophila ericetorum]|nr:hypothetical protein [Icmadophila ericetorum]
MFFSTSTIASSLLLAGSALAQYGGSVAMPTGEALSTTAVQVQVVQVSDSSGTLSYNPSTIFASVGSLVQFQFNPKNHTVTQSTFANPCVPIQNIMPSTMGFFSGFMPTAFGEAQPVFTVMVNDTSPIWFYCSQAKHCQKGMVGVINPPMNSNKTQASFAALAALAPQNLFPGEMSDSSSFTSSMLMGTGTYTASSTMSTYISNSSYSGSTITASSSLAVSTTSGALSRFVASRQSMAAAGLSFVAASALLFL